ncbi:MAG TPA: four helix bundle protein [Gemmatimonadaceae bacterium]|nr:four helix bundle protein [Gemmatimonadaceae bacterium]
MQDFKQIKAWQRAHALAIELHKATRHFSRVNAGTLRKQLTSAADSVAATIVEGCGAATSPEFARYLDIAIKSANETEYHLLAARDRELISQRQWEKFTAEVVEIRKMTIGYRKRVLANDRRER